MNCIYLHWSLCVTWGYIISMEWCKKILSGNHNGDFPFICVKFIVSLLAWVIKMAIPVIRLTFYNIVNFEYTLFFWHAEFDNLWNTNTYNIFSILGAWESGIWTMWKCTSRPPQIWEILFGVRQIIFTGWTVHSACSAQIKGIQWKFPFVPVGVEIPSFASNKHAYII